MEKYNDTIKRIQPLAERYMETQKLNYPINNTMQLLTAKGYYIIKSAAPLNLSGFYMKKDNYPFIFVNTNHTLGRQNFSLWHEVYHHIMNHKNGISDFNADSLEEREAEIFAGIILLPRKEIDKWISHALTSPETIVKMSDYYQMSFQSVLVRLMQEQHIDYETYKSLKKYSSLENVTALKHLYEQCHLDTSIMYPTYKTQISENIMTILQKNYAANKTSGEKINEIIEMIERLSDEA
ncbi:ImmA/IrrE family metallo-endopeptidase [Macrococcoides canis]|uniref:ImmA/IrrE family metallo-endopeptidase n=1 Tax=Macrococcoides canis TaxID=1855823 RepID=UPI001F5E7C1A|nr:ImmA/IrrE family metallo-endopeptidase [Macrococcus canis]